MDSSHTPARPHRILLNRSSAENRSATFNLFTTVSSLELNPAGAPPTFLPTCYQWRKMHTLRTETMSLQATVTRQVSRSLSLNRITLLIVFGISWSAFGSAESPPETRSTQIKVAAVQISGYDKGDLPRPNYDPVKLIAPYIDKAAQDGAQLVVFPEYVLGHIAVPGSETQRICEAAKRNQIYVIIGCWEVAQDGTYANTALIFDRDGKIFGKYHKTHAAVDTFEGKPAYSMPPTNHSREWFLENDPEWKMEKGKSLPVFEFDFGTVGIMTCYDGWFPEPPRILSLQGAELIVWINGRRGKVEDYIVKTIMFQSHVAMIATNQAYGSGTMIADQGNQIIAQAPDQSEAYISAKIDLRRVRQRRDNSRNFQQRRPDLYQPLLQPLAK